MCQVKNSDDALTSTVASYALHRSRPRLMYVLGLAPQKIGGLEKFLRYFASALDAAGWDSVLCFDGPIADEFREYISASYIEIESLNNQGALGLGCAGELWRLLRKYKPQTFVYAFHGVMRCFPWLAKIAGCKRIFFNDHSSRAYGQVAAPLSLSKRIVGRTLTSPLTAIISVSDFTRRTCMALGTTSARNVVVTNGVEVHGIDLEKRAAFRGKYGISCDHIVITQVCWMVETKGVDVMLRAASALLREYSGVHFLFVGDGPQLPEYRELAHELGIADKVTFTGLLNNPTAMGVFDATDIYCQASVWQEASGLAALEAMSVKLPVVASNTGGLPENVRDGRTGILVPVGDVDAICAALKRLVANPDLRRNMGEAGYESVLRTHRIEDTARKYVELFVSQNLTEWPTRTECRQAERELNKTT